MTVNKLKIANEQWTNSPLRQLLKVRLPLIQAPMAGSAATPEFVAAVANAGGLGSLGAGYMSDSQIRNAIKKIRQLSPHPFAVNLFIPEIVQASEEKIALAKHAIQACCPEFTFDIDAIKPPFAPSFDEQMDSIIEEKVPIFSFTFGIPSEYWIRRLKKNGIILIGTATTLEEAKLLELHDIDVIVAQGSEAGGHRGTFIGKAEDALMHNSSLVSLLVEHVKRPIVSAGGIMLAKDIVAALSLGAAGVQMGTAFLSCFESSIHPLYKKLLLNLSKDETTLTRAFSGKLARGITNQFILNMQKYEETILDYPIQNALTTSMRSQAAKNNRTEYMSLWAGQAAHLCKEITVAQLIEELSAVLLCLLQSK